MAFDYEKPNKPSSPLIVPADPSVEGTNSGVNGGAGCNPGIGIASAEPDPKVTDWSHDVRDPQKSGWIGWGGDSVEPGEEDADIPDLLVVDYANGDFNDTYAFVQATSATDGTATGQTVATGYITASKVAVEIGQWIWAKKDVAGPGVPADPDPDV